jgi:hypothetical protein
MMASFRNGPLLYSTEFAACCSKGDDRVHRDKPTHSFPRSTQLQVRKNTTDIVQCAISDSGASTLAVGPSLILVTYELNLYALNLPEL